MKRLPTPIVVELEKTGLKWELLDGKKHRQIRIEGRLVAILPLNAKYSDSDQRALKNTVAQIRRAARAIKGTG